MLLKLLQYLMSKMQLYVQFLQFISSVTSLKRRKITLNQRLQYNNLLLQYNICLIINYLQ